MTPLFDLTLFSLFHAMHVSHCIMLAGVPTLIIGFAWRAYIMRASAFDLNHDDNSGTSRKEKKQ